MWLGKEMGGHTDTAQRTECPSVVRKLINDHLDDMGWLEHYKEPHGRRGTGKNCHLGLRLLLHCEVWFVHVQGYLDSLSRRSGHISGGHVMPADIRFVQRGDQKLETNPPASNPKPPEQLEYAQFE